MPFLRATVVAPKKSEPPPGLGQRLGAAQPALESRLKVFPLLLLGPEHVESLTADGYQRVEAGERRGQRPDLFEGNDFVLPLQGPASVLGGETETQQLSAGGVLQVLPRVSDFVRVHVQNQLPGHRLDELSHLASQASLTLAQHRFNHG